MRGARTELVAAKPRASRPRASACSGVERREGARDERRVSGARNEGGGPGGRPGRTRRLLDYSVPVTFSPMIAAMRRPRNAILAGLTGSPRMAIPKTAAPNAPMPTHTA